jgi:hypothetical protein
MTCRAVRVIETNLVDANTLKPRLDRVLAMRGDPKTGVGAQAWGEVLADVDVDTLMRIVIAATRELLVPDWADRRKKDLRPQAALDAAEAWLNAPSPETAAQAKAAAKACTEARNETFGTDHRVPEAARHVAWAVSKREPAGLYEALATIETELLARIALTGEYHRGPEQRRAVAEVVRRILVPPEAPAAPVTSAPTISSEPVPYSPDTHFELGQRIAHKKFGEVSVTSVGETWIEVTVADGSKKRLAHKP